MKKELKRCYIAPCTEAVDIMLRTPILGGSGTIDPLDPIDDCPGPLEFTTQEDGEQL